jgi:hypothetical protein
MLRRIYSPIKENGIWRSRYNHELNKLYNEPNIVKVIKVGRSGYLFRLQEQNRCKELTLHKPEGTRRVGRPIRWLVSVEEDLKTIGFRNWRRKSQDWDQWRAIVKRCQGSSWTVAPEEEEATCRWRMFFDPYTVIFRLVMNPIMGTNFDAGLGVCVGVDF